jgi:Transposase DDE domain
LLVPMLEGTQKTFKELKMAKDILKAAKLTADAGYSSEANREYVFEHHVDAYVADNLYRKRDPRFKDAPRHKPSKESAPHAKRKPQKTLFEPTDFQLAADHSHCVCPAGQRLNRNSACCQIGDFDVMKFRGTERTCGKCPLRAQCLRHPERTPRRQVAFFLGRTPGKPEKYMTKMKRKLDSEQGRYEYSRRLGTVERVFANIRHTHRLNRFSLRGKKKVNAQWLLFCLVHNIGKVQRYGATAWRKTRTTKRISRTAA